MSGDEPGAPAGEQAGERVVMYGTPYCPYCMAARALLKRKGVAFREIGVAGNAAAREEMQQKSGRRTVPQIFIDEQPIGGYDELQDLADRGVLDRLLAN